METDITKKGTPVPTRFGITLHVGDVVRAKFYTNTENGGTACPEHEGTLEFYPEEGVFLLRSTKNHLLITFNLRFATKPVIVKKWDE